MRTHGKASTYRNGCRCDACRAAHSAYMLGYMHRTGRHRPAAEVNAERAAAAALNHGTEGTYKRCKCSLCRDAAAVARQKRRDADRDAVNAYERRYRARKRAERAA